MGRYNGGSPLRTKDGSPCPYCTRTMKLDVIKVTPTFDHIIPKSRTKRKGGRGIIVCSECNFMKADCTLEEFLVTLQRKNKALQEFIDLNNERLENIRFLLKIGIEEST